jgi:hypothetical protein
MCASLSEKGISKTSISSCCFAEFCCGVFLEGNGNLDFVPCPAFGPDGAVALKTAVVFEVARVPGCEFLSDPFLSCAGFCALFVAAAPDSVGFGFRSTLLTLVGCRVVLGTWLSESEKARASSGIRRFVMSFLVALAVCAPNSSSEGTSKMSRLRVGARALLGAPASVAAAPAFFRVPFAVEVYLRGRSGEGASLFGGGSGSGVVIEGRREDLP